jgi:hypothetical protein
MDKSDVEFAGAPWRDLYQLGGVAALLTVAVGIVEITLSFLPGGNPTAVVTAVDWYAFFQSNWFFGLRNLGLLNIFLTALGLLTSFALYGAHRRAVRTYATLALAIAILGAAVFYATNRAFPMLALSRQYAAATTEARRTLLAAAGEAMLSVGRSHTAGTYPAFFLSETSTILMSWVMLRGKVFSRVSAYIGLVGFGLLLAFDTCVSFMPALWNEALIAAMLGGLASMAWDILVARRLFHLGRTA